MNLLGKTVKPEHILAGRGDDAVAKLALEAIAEERGVDVDALANDLARLETVVPGLKSRRLRGELKTGLVVSLALDISAATANVFLRTSNSRCPLRARFAATTAAGCANTSSLDHASYAGSRRRGYCPASRLNASSSSDEG